MDSTSEGEGESTEEVVDLTHMEDPPSIPPGPSPVSTETSDTPNKSLAKPKSKNRNKKHPCSAPPKSRCVEAYKCPICRDYIRKGIPVATTCGHVFCEGCLLKALQRARQCPLCRKILRLNGFQRIFL